MVNLPSAPVDVAARTFSPTDTTTDAPGKASEPARTRPVTRQPAPEAGVCGAAGVGSSPAGTLAARQARPRPAAPGAAAPAATAGPLAEAVPLVDKRLPNGLDVVILEDHSEPLVTVELAVRNGSFTEPPELNGLS